MSSITKSTDIRITGIHDYMLYLDMVFWYDIKQVILKAQRERSIKPGQFQFARFLFPDSTKPGQAQDRINACVVRARGETQDRPIGIVAVHGEPCAIEVSNRGL